MMIFFKRIFTIVIIHCLVFLYTVESQQNDDSPTTPPSARDTKKIEVQDVASPKHKHRHHHKAKQAVTTPTDALTNPEATPVGTQAKKKPKSFRAKAGDALKQPHSAEKKKKSHNNEPAPSVEKLKSHETQEKHTKSSEEKENLSIAKSKEEVESKDSLRNGDDDEDDSGDRKITGIPIEEADPDPSETKNIHQRDIDSKEGETPDRVASAAIDNSGTGEK